MLMPLLSFWMLLLMIGHLPLSWASLGTISWCTWYCTRYLVTLLPFVYLVPGIVRVPSTIYLLPSTCYLPGTIPMGRTTCWLPTTYPLQMLTRWVTTVQAGHWQQLVFFVLVVWLLVVASDGLKDWCWTYWCTVMVANWYYQLLLIANYQ